MIGCARAGSALLLVLGFMALMTMGAVAFSVWMRATRLPVAHVAENERGRFLLQAALARAMSEIDADVGERLAVGWPERVRSADSPAATNGVVPVLTFEALAYLPPGLVEAVRSRAPCAQTARWQRLDFDAGRVAYLAVDVSDLPDANVVRATMRRTSASDGRLSLRPFFADDAAAAAFDGKLEAGRTAESDIPYVSLLDLGLVTGDAARILTGDDPGALLCTVDSLDEGAEEIDIRPQVEEALDEVGRRVLADYLDTDHVPSALDIPCAERVPQVGAVGWIQDGGVPVSSVTISFPFRSCPGLDGTFCVRLSVSVTSEDGTFAASGNAEAEVDPEADFDDETPTRSLTFALPTSCLPPAADGEGLPRPPTSLTVTLSAEVADADAAPVDRTPPLAFSAVCAAGRLVSVTPSGRDVADARINWKPEHWHVSEKPVAEWRGKDCQDGCAVSDAGYVQSVTEIGFLPREDGTALDAAELGLSDGDVKGARVDPFTTSTNILLMALMATPRDWRAAATNAPTMCAGTFEELTDVRRSDLEKVAGGLMTAFQGAANENWTAAYDAFDWLGEGRGEDPFPDTAFGTSLTVADRRFLRDYWRGCFAKRQQLFLVFTRVEYGPRGVAVVARDPRPGEDGAPHRMKVLFQYQFDQRF